MGPGPSRLLRRLPSARYTSIRRHCTFKPNQPENPGKVAFQRSSPLPQAGHWAPWEGLAPALQWSSGARRGRGRHWAVPGPAWHPGWGGRVVRTEGTWLPPARVTPKGVTTPGLQPPAHMYRHVCAHTCRHIGVHTCTGTLTYAHTLTHIHTYSGFWALETCPWSFETEAQTAGGLSPLGLPQGWQSRPEGPQLQKWPPRSPQALGNTVRLAWAPSTGQPSQACGAQESPRLPARVCGDTKAA